ncbi:MAG: hypothetical protein O2967_20155 [Proteobacteria bacterium]|nr:hypothetical protein [Pseudomonadota bacterium]
MQGNRHYFIALSNPVAGREDEYNAWYDAKHVPECLRVAGFKSGQRFKLSASLHGEPQQRYLALYELEGDDPQAILDELEATRDDRTPNDAFDRASLSMWVFSPIGEKQAAPNDDD